MCRLHLLRQVRLPVSLDRLATLWLPHFCKCHAVVQVVPHPSSVKPTGPHQQHLLQRHPSLLLALRQHPLQRLLRLRLPHQRPRLSSIGGWPRAFFERSPPTCLVCKGATLLVLCRHQFYQMQNRVTVDVFAKGIQKEQVRGRFYLTVSQQDREGR